MVIRFFTQKNLATAVAIGALASCCLPTNSYGQIVAGGQEATLAGEAPPPTDPGDPNPTENPQVPTEDPQVAPEGEEPETLEPNEELICGTLENSFSNSCPRKVAVNCSDKTDCQDPDIAGNQRCIPDFLNKLRRPKEVFVGVSGKIGQVPRPITEGVAKVFIKSEQI